MVNVLVAIGVASLLNGSHTDVETWTSYKEEQAVLYQVDQTQDLMDELKDFLINLEENIGLTSQIQVLDLQYTKGILLIDLSEELISYGGGNAAEHMIIKELLKWGFENIQADKITLLVDGSIEGFPEGTLIHQWTREVYTNYYQ